MITSDEIINDADSVSKNWSPNVMSTMSTNLHKMDCYILHTVVILLFTTAMICYHYTKHRPKLKKHC